MDFPYLIGLNAYETHKPLSIFDQQHYHQTPLYSMSSTEITLSFKAKPYQKTVKKVLNLLKNQLVHLQIQKVVPKKVLKK